jgi:tryptophan 2,3-dioxygenase
VRARLGPLNYWDYIKVEELLGLQKGLHEDGTEPSKDEVLFITVHQVAELLFKLVLRELDEVRGLFRQNPVPDHKLAAGVRSLRRCVTIFQSATNHWRVVETLNTRDYLEFRDQLIGASGFQSAQMRELEVLLGLDDDKRIALGGEKSYKDMLRGPKGASSPALERVEKRIAGGPSLKHALYEWLARTPIDGSSAPEQVESYLKQFIASHEKHAQVQLDIAAKNVNIEVDRDLLKARYDRDVAEASNFLLATDEPDDQRAFKRHVRAALVFIESHRELPRLAWPREVIDTIIALEQAMIIWRQRHVRMVERMIGRRTGTGGSDGVDYLERTAMEYRIFDEIWAVRRILLRRDLVPALDHADDYGFRIED